MTAYTTVEKYGGDRLLIAFEQPVENERVRKRPALFARSCSADGHGKHEALDLAEFSVEANGLEWVPKEHAVLSYCEECLDDERSTLDYRDDVEVIEDLITTGIQWEEFKPSFEPLDVAEGRELAHCPYCGAELESVHQRRRRGTCPEHGELELEVEQCHVAPS